MPHPVFVIKSMYVIVSYRAACSATCMQYTAPMVRNVIVFYIIYKFNLACHAAETLICCRIFL